MLSNQNIRKHRAISVCQSMLGKSLIECWPLAKREHLKLKVRSLNKQVIRHDNHDDDTHISVVVDGGIVIKSWLG